MGLHKPRAKIVRDRTSVDSKPPGETSVVRTAAVKVGHAETMVWAEVAEVPVEVAVAGARVEVAAPIVSETAAFRRAGDPEAVERAGSAEAVEAQAVAVREPAVLAVPPAWVAAGEVAAAEDGDKP